MNLETLEIVINKDFVERCYYESLVYQNLFSRKLKRFLVIQTYFTIVKSHTYILS